MMKVDTTTLADSITQCFDNATDGRFSSAQRAAFLADGKRLRGLLLNLLSAPFNNGTQQVINANTELKAVNTELKASAANIAQTASTLNNVAHLVGTLDGGSASFEPLSCAITGVTLWLVATANVAVGERADDRCQCQPDCGEFIGCRTRCGATRTPRNRRCSVLVGARP